VQCKEVRRAPQLVRLEEPAMLKERECSDCDKSDGLLKRLAITSTVQTGICGRVGKNLDS
jgi:hypothetical protein